jgi:hypothetical protein
VTPPRDPPDSGRGRVRRPASLSDTIDEADERAQAAAAVIERDVREAMSVERPEMATPRTRTPAEAALRAAVDELRRLTPEWHVAEQVARALDAIEERFAEQERKLGALEAIRVAAAKTIRRLKAWAASSSIAAAGAVAAVIFGLGVKRGHEDAEQAAAKERARLVKKHERVLTVERPLIDLTIDNRLGAHDRALGLDTRQPITFPANHGDTP